VVLANPGTIVHSDPQLQRLHDRLNEVNRKLAAGELDIPPEYERSPSPEPIYDASGVRLNTREIRCARARVAGARGACCAATGGGGVRRLPGRPACACGHASQRATGCLLH
jgi:hypothetical protein